MRLRDNIFIKDLLNNESTTGYWKYKIDNFEYYIPNNGYLVMIDTNYRDLSDSGKTVYEPNVSEREYKMYGKMDGGYISNNKNDESYNKNTKLVDKIQYDNLINILSRNNFGKEFTNDGGIIPNNDVLELISKINKELIDKKDKNGSLESIIPSTMKQFLHNRIGTPLTVDEIKFVSNDVAEDLIIGKMYAYETSQGVFTWMMYYDVNEDDNEEIVVYSRNDFREDEEIIKKIIPKSNLRNYLSVAEIKQKYKANEAKMSDSDLLETYTLKTRSE